MKLSHILYIVFLLVFTVFSYLFVDVNLQYLSFFYTGFANDNRVVTTIAYIVFIVVFFIFYWFFVTQLAKSKIKDFLFKRLLTYSTVVLIFSYPAMLSYDIFNYMTTAKVLFFHQENPYIIMPIEFLNDSYLSFTRAANKVALYGPLWLFLTGIPFSLSLFHFLGALLGFKLLAVAFFIGCILLLRKMNADIVSISLFALNPLVLIETLVSGHNDMVMMFFALLSIYFLRKEKYMFSIFLLILSILVKLVTVFLLPIFIYFIWKKLSKREVKWDTIFLLAWGGMFAIFLLSFVREEIYPWYATWFLIFIPFIKNTVVRGLSVVLSFSLLLRYVPFMLLGTYFGPTPFIKITLTAIPLVFFIGYRIIRRVK